MVVEQDIHLESVPILFSILRVILNLWTGQNSNVLWGTDGKQVF